MKKAETVYQQLTDNIKDVLFIVSPNWQTLYYISPSYEHIWGKTCESLLAEPLSWIDSLHPDDKPQIRQYINEITNEDLVGVNFPDYRVVKPDGSIKWLKARCFPVRSESGEIFRIAGIAVDITERKQIEEEKDELICSLEKALGEIKTLRGILPICSFCKNVRNDQGYYEQIEEYIHKHSEIDFSHTICPKCAQIHYPDFF